MAGDSFAEFNNRQREIWSSFAPTASKDGEQTFAS